MIKENDSIQLNTNDRVDLGLLIDGLITTTHLVDRLNTQLTDVERHYSLARGPVKQEGDQKKAKLQRAIAADVADVKKRVAELEGKYGINVSACLA